MAVHALPGTYAVMPLRSPSRPSSEAALRVLSTGWGAGAESGPVTCGHTTVWALLRPELDPLTRFGRCASSAGGAGLRARPAAPLDRGYQGPASTALAPPLLALGRMAWTLAPAASPSLASSRTCCGPYSPHWTLCPVGSLGGGSAAACSWRPAMRTRCPRLRGQRRGLLALQRGATLGMGTGGPSSCQLQAPCLAAPVQCWSIPGERPVALSLPRAGWHPGWRPSACSCGI